MGRPKGSRNASTIANAAPAVSAASSAEVATETAASNGIRRQYREGAAQIVIPSSNSSAFLFGSPGVEEKPADEFHVEQSNTTVAEDKSKEQEAQEHPAGESSDQSDQENKPAEEQKNLTPETEEVIYLEDLLKKMNIDPSKVKTKTKVDGVEADVPFSEVKKSYQLEQHLTKRGQKIGEERRRLEEERNRLMASQASQASQAAPDKPASEVEILRRKLEALESVIQPTIYQNARQQLANELKEQGFPDFNDYIEKIEARVAAEPDDNKWKFYNTFDGAKQLYFQIKLEESRNQPAKQPPIQKKEAPRPPVIKIDGGNRPSQPVVDDYSIKMNELLAKWKENPTKNKHLLQEILRMKDALYLK